MSPFVSSDTWGFRRLRRRSLVRILMPRMLFLTCLATLCPAVAPEALFLIVSHLLHLLCEGIWQQIAPTALVQISRCHLVQCLRLQIHRLGKGKLSVILLPAASPRCCGSRNFSPVPMLRFFNTATDAE